MYTARVLNSISLGMGLCLLSACDQTSVSEQSGGSAAHSEEQRLKMSNAALNAIPDVVFFKDVDGVYLGGNRAWLELIGKSDIGSEGMLGKTDFDLFPEEVAEGFREMDRAMLSQGRTTRNDEWVTYPDGTRVLLETVKTPFVDEHGELLGVLGISRDVTHREAVDSAGVAVATDAWYEALNAVFEGDSQPMKDIWSHGEDVVYMGPAGDYLIGWEAVEKAWDIQTAQNLGGRVSPTRVNMIVGKDMALINCIEIGENQVDGETKTVEIRSSTTFRKEEGAWKAVEHQTDLLAHVESI
jgi:PAS domain S-box-containing protein